jgi:hypothetical protein
LSLHRQRSAPPRSDNAARLRPRIAAMRQTRTSTFPGDTTSSCRGPKRSVPA